MMKYVQSRKNALTPPKRVWFDFETYSEVSLTDYGAWAYAEHPSTEVILTAVALDDGPTLVYEDFPTELMLFALEHGALFCAHNLGFEDAIWQKTLKLPAIPAHQMYDTMTHALSVAYPAKLDELGKFVGLPEDKIKLKQGKELVRFFCMPQRCGMRALAKDNPARWGDFIQYAARDVETMRHIAKELPTVNLSDQYWKEVRYDIGMNRRGVAVDLDLAQRLYRHVEARGKVVNERLAEITEGRVTSVGQIARILKELNRIGLENLQKDSVTSALLRDDLTPVEREILKLRQEAGLAATKKYAAFLNRTSSDGRLRGFMRLYGARRTGRYNSQGVQLQNLVRPTMKWPEIRDWIESVKTNAHIPTDQIMEIASNCLRPTLVAPPGKIFGISDLSQIEARVLPWLANDFTTLDVFRSGRDIYIDAASRIYDLSYSNISKDQRFVGKTATLALGYGQWVHGFIKFCEQYGAIIDEESAFNIVSVWRDTHPEIVSLWKATENAFKHVVRYGQPAKIRDRLFVFREGKDICFRLPSGRCLVYPRMFLKHDSLMFYGDYGLQDTYGGKLVENATQAVARDIMVGNLFEMQDSGFDVLFTVHDEVITECPKDGYDNTDILDALLSKPPEWADGLPLAAEGFLSPRYRKED